MHQIKFHIRYKIGEKEIYYELKHTISVDLKAACTGFSHGHLT